MQILDNINNTIKDDLQKEVKKGSKISIAAACFSIYAYQELKKQLEGVEELHFIFTSPTFITEKTPKAKREFYIPRLSRERSLYGTEFEVKLRNELTQKAIAKECAEWIRKKVVFKSNITQEQMMGFITVDESTYMPINGFTTVDLGCERGNNAYYPVQKTESFENANYFLKLFDDLWHDDKKLQEVTDIVIESISTAYKENSPDFIYFFTLYNIFNEFLEDISDDELPNEATGFKDSKIWGMLYNFQRDAVLAIISKLEKFNGCILADSVGLGKTFTALAVIKYYENRNKSVLVLCPKKLSENWNTYKGNYINNPIASDRLRYDDQNTDFFSVGKKVKIDLADMDYVSWQRELEKDADNLELLSLMIADITPEHDTKLQTLFDTIRSKQKHPINPGNRKLIIFTAFSDTADYLYANISAFAKKEFGLETAEITGSVDGRTTIPRLRADLNTVLTCFSPLSKGRAVLMPGSTDELDILIATDCISEGQNLQDCDYLINYDIHWNPVRIIQRFGRIDRIGSKNSQIQLVNFWPDMDLDEYINLKSRVETRMKISVMTSTGDDDLINPEEKGDLEYRKAQLKRLQEEVVDIEEMSSGISIMDLGLNEFRLDLLEYIKKHDDVEKAPNGMHAVVPKGEGAPAGVVFVLRNINDSVNKDNRNRIHPFYMVYISEDGEIVCDYLNPKKMLDTIRLLCKGKDEPCVELCRRFNEETEDGRRMGAVSELLSDAINSIIDVKEENDIDSLFKSGGTTALMSAVSGLDDFELICFLVVK